MTAAVLLAMLLFPASGGPDGKTVLAHVEAAVAGVQDYTVTVEVVADIERLKVPPMRATLYYKRPDKVHVASKGFALLPRESMGMQFSRLNERYAVDSIGVDGAGGAAQYRLVLRPRDERSAVRRVLLWVHGERWTPERIEIPQGDGRAMTAVFTYARAGGFWLPSGLVVHFEAGAPDSTGRPPDDPFAGGAPSARPRPAGRAGTVTVRYADYRVNTGLGDEVFDEVRERK